MSLFSMNYYRSNVAISMEFR